MLRFCYSTARRPYVENHRFFIFFAAPGKCPEAYYCYYYYYYYYYSFYFRIRVEIRVEIFSVFCFIFGADALQE